MSSNGDERVIQDSTYHWEVDLSYSDILRSPSFIVPNRDAQVWILCLKRIYYEIPRGGRRYLYEVSLHLKSSLTPGVLALCEFVCNGREMSNKHVYSCGKPVRFLVPPSTFNFQEKGVLSVKISVADDSYSEQVKDWLRQMKPNGQIVTGDYSFPVYRNLISPQSSVLKYLFELDKNSPDYPTIHLCSFDLGTVSALVTFLYTGEPPYLDVFSAQNLIEAAEVFAVEDLKEVCSDFLVQNLAIENAVDFLILAELVQASSLKVCALNFIERYHSLLENTYLFKWALDNMPGILSDILEE